MNFGKQIKIVCLNIFLKFAIKLTRFGVQFLTRYHSGTTPLHNVDFLNKRL